MSCATPSTHNPCGILHRFLTFRMTEHFDFLEPHQLAAKAAAVQSRVRSRPTVECDVFLAAPTTGPPIDNGPSTVRHVSNREIQAAEEAFGPAPDRGGRSQRVIARCLDNQIPHCVTSSSPPHPPPAARCLRRRQGGETHGCPAATKISLQAARTVRIRPSMYSTVLAASASRA
jgi:hypothetical protein